VQSLDGVAALPIGARRGPPQHSATANQAAKVIAEPEAVAFDIFDKRIATIAR
jgi:hypothetical protein